MTSEWAILHAGALGDLVLTIQLALRLIDPRCTSPGGRLHVISRTDPGDLSDCAPAIARVSSEALGLHWAYADDDRAPPDALRRAIAGRHVIAALGEPDAPAVTRLRQLAPASIRAFEPAPQPGSFRHITDQWATQLEGQGLLAPKCIRRRGCTSVQPPAALRERGRSILATATPAARDDRPLCTLHPGSGGMLKCWALDAFIALARALRKTCETVFLLGPAEVERGVAEFVQRNAPEIPRVVSAAANELAAVLSNANCCVGNDAGPTHLAALLGRPTIALFGPTAHEVWRPLGDRAAVVVGQPRSDPTRWGLSVDAVATRVAERLERDPAGAALAGSVD